MKYNNILIGLLLVVLLFPVISAINGHTADAQLNWYNFSYPNGTDNNELLVYNGAYQGVLAGIHVNFSNVGAVPLSNNVYLSEIIPYPTGNVFTNVWTNRKIGTNYNTYIDTNMNMFNFDENFSISAWVKMNGAGTYEIVSWKPTRVDNASDLYFTLHYNTDKNLYVTYGDATSGINSFSNLSNHFIDNDTWYQIGITYNANNRILNQTGADNQTILRWYLNGVEQPQSDTGFATLSGLGNVTYDIPHFIVGALGGVGGNQSEGSTFKITNLGIWSKVLTPSEMFAQYNSSNAPAIFPTGVTRVGNFNASYNIGTNAIVFNIGDYFSGYSYVNVYYFDSRLGGFVNLTTTRTGTTKNSFGGAIQTNLVPTINNGNIYLYFTPTSVPFYSSIQVIVGNEFGNTLNAFQLNSSSTNTPTGVIGTPPTSNVTGTDTFLGGISNTLLGLFPDANLLSTSTKIAFVLITLIIVTLACVLIAGKNYLEIGLYTSLVFDALFFIFFVVIGYIGIGILLFMGLIAGALTFFKIRSKQ